MKEQAVTRPDAKRIIDTIVEALHKGIERFDEEFSLVPGEYEVLLHPAAYEELAPIFPYVRERAEVRLNRELDRLNGTGLPHVVRRLAAWIKRLFKSEGIRQAADASARSFRPARYKPAGFGWRIAFEVALDEDADLGYVAVVATLAAPRRDNLAGPQTLRLTLRGADGSFQTRLLPAGAPTLAAADAGTPPPSATSQPAPATRRSHPGAEAGLEAPGTPLARLSFRDEGGPQTYLMTTPEIAVGRGGDGAEGVHLLVQTLPDVSREHLRLRYDAARNTFLIKDVSTYGTTVDGRPVQPSREKATHGDLDHWEPLPAQTTIGLAGVLFIDFKSMV